MYDPINVLVVDDEVIERKAVIEILRACQVEGLVILEAVNGKDAVEKSRKERPDFVIMDMQMPVMNGLDALEVLYQELPDLFAVILTAYDEFDYAVKALKLGVEDYILKPVRKQKLLECMERYTQKRQRQVLSAGGNERVDQALTALFPYMEDNLIASIIMGGNQNGQVRQFLQYLFPDRGQFILAVGTLAAGGEALLQNLRGKLEEIGVKIAGSAMGKQLAAVLQFPEGDISSQRRQVEWELAALGGDWKLSGTVAEPNQFGEVYRQLAFGEASKAADTTPYLPAAMEKDIAIKLATNDELGAVKLFEEFFAAYYWDAAHMENLQKQLLSVCVVVDYYLAKIIGAMPLGEIPDFRRIVGKKELFQASHLYIASRINTCQQRQRPKMHELISAILDDIEQHYRDGLYSLNAAAEHLGLTPAYLSKVFKMRMGKTFTEYLSEVRIDEAKKLIKTSDMEIAEISQNCGFNSATYFCKVFKKFVGKSASSYRDGRG